MAASASAIPYLQESQFMQPLTAKALVMPPRGGNDALSDDEVRAAVDYMIRLVLPQGAE